MTNVLLPTAKSESGFQRFVLTMSLRNKPRPECSSDFNQDTLRELVECNLCKSTRQLVLDPTHPNLKS